MLELSFARVRPGAILPARMTAQAAGLDLFACVPAEPVVLAPGARALVPTGWAVAIPEHHEGQVRPRSGLALRHGVTVLNAPGTIDADYRGELGVVLVNLGVEPFEIRSGDRIAQLVIAPVSLARPVLADILPPAEGSTRGPGGFGSTG